MFRRLLYHQWRGRSPMMTSSNGNIFRVTGPLCGEFTGDRWPMTRSFDVFFDLRLNKPLSKQSWSWWFETPSRSLWRHNNAPEWQPPVGFRQLFRWRFRISSADTTIYDANPFWFVLINTRRIIFQSSYELLHSRQISILISVEMDATLHGSFWLRISQWEKALYSNASSHWPSL